MEEEDVDKVKTISLVDVHKREPKKRIGQRDEILLHKDEIKAIGEKSWSKDKHIDSASHIARVKFTDDSLIVQFHI